MASFKHEWPTIDSRVCVAVFPTSRLSIPRDALTVGADEVGAAQVNEAEERTAHIPQTELFDESDVNTGSEAGSEAGSDVRVSPP